MMRLAYRRDGLGSRRGLGVCRLCGAGVDGNCVSLVGDQEKDKDKEKKKKKKDKKDREGKAGEEEVRGRSRMRMRMRMMIRMMLTMIMMMMVMVMVLMMQLHHESCLSVPAGNDGVIDVVLVCMSDTY
jgi:hypothetical protein